METPSSSSSAGSAPVATVAPPTPSSHQVRRRHGARRSSSARPSFLWDLGRATLRGIRRCPRCGVYNGTRGLSCKNKACGATLRSATGAERSGGRAGLELVRVVTEEEEGGGEEGGGATQVFSVCQRGRGGGVSASQWGFLELIATDNAISAINLLGHCFLPACRRGQRSIKSEAPSDSVCVHLKQAGEEGDGVVVATTLAIKSSALDALRASGVREELWRLAAATPGPLVQRVATNTLVVKCHADSQHPLGLLHLSVAPGGRSQGGERGGFHCPCQVGGRRSRGGGATGPAHPPNPVSSTPPPLPCLHVYAAVCAFNSDEKLTSEFSAFISNISSGEQFRSLADKPSLDLAVPHQKVKKPRLDASGGVQGLEEKSLSMSFHQWLAGVTERIHQTMHYQFTGNPQPLVFYVPQNFFNALQQRFSLGSRKRRLPNFTTAFVRNDGLPLGSFSKFTWHINSLTQVQRIFSTPEFPLEVSQSFIRNSDGSFSRFRCPEPEPEPAEGGGASIQPIRPLELRTVLTVGPGSGDPEGAGPLVLEWIPDVLPRCRIGELRISFRFTHQGGTRTPETRTPETRTPETRTPETRTT